MSLDGSAASVYGSVVEGVCLNGNWREEGCLKLCSCSMPEGGKKKKKRKMAWLIPKIKCNFCVFCDYFVVSLGGFEPHQKKEKAKNVLRAM